MNLRRLVAVLVLAVPVGALAGGDSWAAWDALGERGDAARTRGKMAEAESAYVEAIAMAGRLGAPLALDPNMSRLVATWASMKQCGPAMSRQQARLAELSKAGRADTREALEPLSLLALLELARGDVQSAVAHLQSTQVLLEKLEGSETPALAPVLTLLAFLQRAQAPAEADDLLRRAVGIRQKPIRTDPLDAAVSRLLQAWTSPPAQASRLWPVVLREARPLIGERHPALAVAWSAYAELLKSRGELASAKKAGAQAGEIQKHPLCPP